MGTQTVQEGSLATATGSIPDGYTRNVLTFQDCFERAVNWLGAFGHDVGTLTTGPPELLRGAIIDAYETVLNAYTWPALEGFTTRYLQAEQTTGTVVYTHATRLLTLTGSTYPTWSPGAGVFFDDKLCQIQTRLSGTQATLDEYLNPGADVASTAYRLFPLWYELPRDFGHLKRVYTEEHGRLRVVPHARILRLYRQDFGTSYVQECAIGGHPYMPSRQVLYAYPPSTAAERVDIAFGRRPRDLRFAGYDTGDTQGTVTVTAGSLTVAGSGTAFTDEMEGAMLRVSRSTTRPTGTHGSNRYAEQYPIKAVNSATSLELAATPSATRSGVAYVVTDPLTIDYSAHTAVLREVEYLLAIAHRSDYVGTCRKEATEALRLAVQGCVAHQSDTVIHGLWDPTDGPVTIET